jgi:hypothetical protein
MRSPLIDVVSHAIMRKERHNVRPACPILASGQRLPLEIQRNFVRLPYGYWGPIKFGAFALHFAHVARLIDTDQEA